MAVSTNPGQMDAHGGLGCTIGGRARKAAKCGQGSHQGDLTAAAFRHARQRRLERIGDPLDVGLENSAELIAILAASAGAGGNAGIGNNQFERPRLVHAGDPLLKSGPVAYVEKDRVDQRAHAATGSGNGIKPLGVTPAQGKRPAIAGIFARQGGTDAAAGAGDED
jgi:hypothetical protein